MIYYVQSGSYGPVKIGFTKARVGSRFSSLQASSPFALIFLGVHSGDRIAEADLHRRFKESRFRGEWYHPVRPLIEHIEATVEETSIEGLLRNDLRALVTVKRRKFWPEEHKKAFKQEFSGYGSIWSYEMGAWTGGMTAPRPQLIEKVEGFLRERDLLPALEVAR